jgi:hypothetical protein
MSCPRLGPSYPTQLLPCSAIYQPLPLRRSFANYFEVPHPFISLQTASKRSIPPLHSQRQPSTGDLSSISIWELWADVTGLHTGRNEPLSFRHEMSSKIRGTCRLRRFRGSLVDQPGPHPAPRLKRPRAGHVKKHRPTSPSFNRPHLFNVARLATTFVSKRNCRSQS